LWQHRSNRVRQNCANGASGPLNGREGRMTLLLMPVDVCEDQLTRAGMAAASHLLCSKSGFSRKNNRQESIQKEEKMSVAKVTEIISSSEKGFDDAVKQGVKRASKTLKNVVSAWVQDQQVTVKNGKISEYRVNLKVTFILKD
jgi:flavin-binding protein dodecin